MLGKDHFLPIVFFIYLSTWNVLLLVSHTWKLFIATSLSTHDTLTPDFPLFSDKRVSVWICITLTLIMTLPDSNFVTNLRQECGLIISQLELYILSLNFSWYRKFICIYFWFDFILFPFLYVTSFFFCVYHKSTNTSVPEKSKNVKQSEIYGVKSPNLLLNL